MSEAAAPAASDEPRDARVPPPRGWRVAALAVPALGAAAAMMFGFFVPMSNAHDNAVSEACHYLPVSWDFVLLGYGDVVAALAAVILQPVLRIIAKRRGWNPQAAWQGTLADVTGILTWLVVLVSAIASLNVYDAQSEYATHHTDRFCAGLAVPGR